MSIDDLYAGYQLQRRYTHRRRHLWPVIIIILVVLTASSIAALFLRGFRIKSFAEQLNSKDLETPTMNVWLLTTQGYHSKLDAYKAGIATENLGLGVYVLYENNQWTWMAGVYTTETDANEVLNQTDLSEKTRVKNYVITGKKFPVIPEVLDPCRQVLDAVQNVFGLLLDLRVAITVKSDTSNLLLDLTTQYNQIKSSVETLQKLNATLQSELVATIIYTANQNILGLQDVIGLDTTQEISSLAVVNTALLKTIFSLDNF